VRATLRTATALCALAGLCALLPTGASAAEFDQYGIESLSVGLSTTQAGAHPDFTTSFKLKKDSGGEPFALTRDVAFKLPPGLIGNPQGFPRCTITQLGNSAAESECPPDSQVGVTEVFLGGSEAGAFFEPIYNMTPPGGDVVARLGFFAGPYQTLVNVRVDPIDYSIIATVEGASAAASLGGAVTTLWGVPADESHDEERLTPAEAINHETPPGGRKAGLPARPFMTNPTDCSTPRQLTLTATSYQLPSQPVSASVPFPQITGCGKVSFSPSFALQPTNPEAAAPSGVDAILEVPQDETAGGLGTSTMKSARVTLPEGFAINPAAGDGLEACSAAQVGFETTEPSHCPEAAKIATVDLEVPALEHTLHGAVYQRTPEPGHLFRFWLVTDEQGVHLKLPAEIEANPLTGQLSTVFSGIPALGGLPQVPVESFALHVFGGPRAPLATPSGCGTYQTSFEFTPWSGRPPISGQAPTQITLGCGKGDFAPRLQAGTLRTFAGTFAPFSFTLTRSDGEANPKGLSLHLPEGLAAKLAGVPLCSDAEAATGACPASTQIGSLAAAAGVGGAPLWIPQPGKAPTAVYLAGPYKGAPYSILARVPAQAGPFDLGTVLNRSAISVDPNNATVTVTSDPLPQILEGVPIAYRALHVEVDRPEFTLNPTDCTKKEITAHLTAADGQSAEASAPFQATNCAKLAYSPKLALSFKGKTKRTGHPAVKAVLTQPPGQANSRGVTVVLPNSEIIDQNHINNPCTRVQFNANACPANSILGTVRATTPILDQPLEGPLYFRSNGGERELPDIVADLRGSGLRVIQVGFVDSVGAKGSEVRRVRTRFLSVPDAPVSKIVLNFYGGKRGLLVNTTNLCAKKRTAKLTLAAQNGISRTSNVAIATGCGGKR